MECIATRTCSVVSSTRHWGRGARRVSRHRWNTDAASVPLSLASGRRGLSLIGQNTNAASLPLARILTQPLSHWPAPTQPLSRWTAPTQPLSYWPAADAASLSLAKLPTRPLCHWPEYRRGHSFIGQITDAATLSLARIPTRPLSHWPEYRSSLRHWPEYRWRARTPAHAARLLGRACSDWLRSAPRSPSK
jgi:hypothetical protein